MKVPLKSNFSWLNCSLRVLHRQLVKNDSVLRVGEPKNRHNTSHNRNKCVICPTRFLHRSTVITTDSGGLMLGTSSSCAIALNFLEQKSFAKGLLMIYDETWRFGSSNHLGVFVSMLSLTTRRSAADFYFCGIVSASWLSGLHRPIQVGVSERHNNSCWKSVGHHIELVSILAIFFTNFFVLVSSNLTCQRLANVICWPWTNQNSCSIHVIYVTPHKIADERQEEVTFQFIDKMHNCPALWDISSPAYKDTKNNQKKMEKIA